MSLFSFLHKNKNPGKQKSTFDDGEFYARAGDASNLGKERSKSHKTNMPVDPVLPEKKRARRRLVGAIALALAAIIGLPMILDSEPKPLENDILIQIPSKNKSFSSPNQQASTPALASASVSAEKMAAEPPMAASDTLDSKEEVVVSPPTSLPSPAPAMRTPINNVGRVEDKEVKEYKETKKTQEIPSHSPANNSRNSTQNSDRHPVQTPAQAHVPISTPKKSSETLIETTRANAILEGKSNVKSNDVVEEHTPQKTTRFVVQVAALADQEKINTLQAKLKSAGIVSHTQKVTTKTGERTRIRVGPYTNKEDAEKVRIKLEKLGLNGSVLPL